MTTPKAAIPDDLHEAVVAQAARENISVDSLIARTGFAGSSVPAITPADFLGQLPAKP